MIALHVVSVVDSQWGGGLVKFSSGFCVPKSYLESGVEQLWHPNHVVPFQYIKIIVKLTVLWIMYENILWPKTWGRTWELSCFIPCNHYIILITGYPIHCMSTLKILFSSPWENEIIKALRKLKEQFLLGLMEELAYPNATSLHTWCTILCIIPLHIPYKYPISPCCTQYMWQEDIGICGIHKEFSDIFNTTIWVDLDNPNLVPTPPQGRFRQQILRLSPTSAHTTIC